MIANKGVKSTRNETLATLLKLRRRHMEEKKNWRKPRQTFSRILEVTVEIQNTPLPNMSAALRSDTSVPYLTFIQLNFALTPQKAAEIRV